MSSQASLGRIITRNTALFVCDMQEKFSSSIKYFPQIVSNTKRILDAAKIMKMPIVYTEQYPKGLGYTTPELEINSYSSLRFEKTQFSMIIPQVQELMKTELSEVNSVILCGIEAHACIRHTTMDLIENGFNVHVVVDACSSRSLTDRKYALEAITKMGANMITTESVILGLAPDSAHPSFKQLQRLCMQSAADTGLV